jgi:hypothetical protein
MKKPKLWALPGICLLFILSFISFSCTKSDLIVSPFSLKVTSTTPESTQQNSACDGNVTAHLNCAVDTSRFAVSLSLQQGDTVMQGSLKIGDSLIAFVPDAELLPLHFYTATLTLAEKGSRATAYSYKWNFTTKEADQFSMTQRSAHVTDFVRDGSMCMQLGNYFYSFGGWTDNGGAVTYNDVYRSSANMSTWEKVQNAPWHPRHVFGCVKKDGKVWVLGGDNLDNSWDVWNSADGINWTKIGTTNPNPVGPREYGGYCTHTINGKEWLYIIGGFGHQDILRSIDGINWETVAADLPVLASDINPNGDGFSGAVASLNGQLYIVCGGGGTAWGPARKTVYRSSDNGITWQPMPDIPGAPRRYTNTCVFDNKIWVVGGYDDNGAGNLRDVWYMTEKGAWHQVETPPDYLGRHATGIGVYNNSLVITCGNYNNDCWVIEKVK